MIPTDVLVLPPSGAAECLRTLVTRLEASGRGRRDVMALTFFMGGAVPVATLARLVRDCFGSAPPPATFVAQAPNGQRRVALEATVLAAPGLRVEHRTCAGVAYSLVTSEAMRQIHCGGIACADPADDTEAQATSAFARMQAVLAAESMGFGHVVRQWGYIEGLLDIRADCPKGHQRYQAFNDVRSIAYASSEFPTGYPAATGIGQAAGGVALEFIALDAPADVQVAPISNPRQTDAHHYSGAMLVGDSLARTRTKTTPKFERAKAVSRGEQETVFVSGTAAIVGEVSVAPGDVAAQTRTTIENIAALVGKVRLSRLRAYVKRASDFEVVRRICEAAFGPIPAVYVQADVCREELLVELEGAACVGAPTCVGN